MSQQLKKPLAGGHSAATGAIAAGNLAATLITAPQTLTEGLITGGLVAQGFIVIYGDNFLFYNYEELQG